MRKTYEWWDIANGLFALGYCTLPVTSFAFYIQYVLSLSCFLQFFFGVFKLRLPVRMPWTGVVVAILAVWTTITSVLMNGELGRSFGTYVWDYHFHWLYHYLIFFMAMDFGHLTGSKVRPVFVNTLLGIYAFSGVIGILQVLHVPFALALSRSSAFGEIFRPTGLGNYSFELGYQGTVGMAIIGARLINRPLKVWEWLAVGYFASIILLAQYRTCYISGILFIGGILLVLQIIRNAVIGVTVGIVGVATLALPVVLFPAKFAYGLRGIDLNDPTIVARELAGRQLQPILDSRPWTGIGADPNIMLGTGYHVFDKWGAIVMDNFYRMMLACFGYPGLALAILALTMMSAGLFFRTMDENPKVRELSFAALLIVGSIIIVNFSGNGPVYFTVGYPLIMMLVVSNRDSVEEGTVKDPSKYYKLLRFIRAKLQ